MFWTRIEFQYRSEKCSWCFKILKLGILVITFLFNLCESSAKESSSHLPSIKHSVTHNSNNSPWGTWSTSEGSILPWDEQPHMPNITPLTLKEHNLRESHTKKKSQSGKNNTNNKSGKHEDVSRGKGKSGSRNNDNNYAETKEDDVDLAVLREKALDFGSLVFNFLSKEILAPKKTGESRGARGILSELANNFKLERKEGEGGGGEGGGDRGVIDWLARLIGVQGKTLGEFLREYQVHVLYDLVFTFFKWIFFLYAGLLIP